jgi:hypothetical protein
VLKVDLYPLWLAGRVELPGLAGVYRRAEVRLGDVRGGDDEWCAVRDQLRSCLAGAGRDVADMGDAVCVAVGDYARADDDARKELDRRRLESGRVPR